MPLDAAGPVSRCDDPAVVGDDEVGIQVLFDDAHAAIAADFAADALPGGLSRKTRSAPCERTRVP